ncbi:MAG: RNase adapter RapZ [Ndongobacter sp.]|nr:RNase adapter RapZ [Ndongobacter sp.]
MNIVIVTGMSGAGKSSALNILEDMGYYCMDNLPPQLMTNFVELAQNANQGIEKAAIGVDIRGGHFFEALKSTIANLKDMKTSVSILFLEASDDILIRRYKELRRPHPMDKAGNIYDGIQRERAYLQDMREMSDEIIDTTKLTLGQLKETLDGLYLNGAAERSLIISVTSFGYKYGILLDADLVFDVRFIPNPYYQPNLRPYTGADPMVRDYIFSFSETEEFMRKLLDLLRFLLPYYEREGKRTLSIGIGCTGGKHRSVAIADALAKRLRAEGRIAVLNHRDRLNW